MNEDYHEEYEDEEESEGLFLSIGDDGKAEIHKQSDYIEVKEKDFDLIKGFIGNNKELFQEYLKKQEEDLK